MRLSLAVASRVQFLGARPAEKTEASSRLLLQNHKVYLILAEWRIGLSTSTGLAEVIRTYFAEFLAGLANAKDIKDAAVLIGALRELGNQLREPRSKSLGEGLLELRGTTVRIYYGFLPGRRAVLVGGYVKKRTDTPATVLGLKRARLKEAQDE